MHIKSLKMVLGSALFLALFWPGHIYAGYIEGIDTTDVNGYGLDSAFTTNSYGYISGKFVTSYSLIDLIGGGMFNYSFDDIKMVTDSFTGHFLYQTPGCCVAVMNGKDSTYAKIKVLQKISGNRYLFRYGRNTKPNDLMMDSSNYDRTVRYKPNNVFINGGYFQWEPPLPNDNHLLGYIVYVQNPSITIDTSAPINIAQWDSLTFTVSTLWHFQYPYIYIQGVRYDMQGKFFNIVAVYTEGRSDFLQGWTHIPKDMNGVVQQPFLHPITNSILIQEENRGFFFSFPLYKQNKAFEIYNLSGNRIAHLDCVNCNRVLWNARLQNVGYGLYIVRAELPDRTVLTQPFLFTK
jgi:hypothetical protein